MIKHMPYIELSRAIIANSNPAMYSQHKKMPWYLAEQTIFSRNADEISTVSVQYAFNLEVLEKTDVDKRETKFLQVYSSHSSAVP